MFPMRIVAVLLLAISLGCATKTNIATNPPATAPTLPTNAIDGTDANAFRVIADAYAFLSSVRPHIADGSLKLSAAQKTAFNDVVIAYDAAYALGVAYHNKISTDAAGLNAATISLQTKLSTATTQIAVPSSKLNLPIVYGELSYEEAL